VSPSLAYSRITPCSGDTHKKSDNSYLLRVTNLDMTLPIEVMVDGRLLPMMVGKEGITIQAKTLPQVDPQGFYLKKVIVE
jgi:hypothetical protein